MAFDEFVAPIEFLAERHRASGGDELVEPALVLCNLQAIGAQHQRALAEDDIAFVYADFPDVVEGDRVGFEVDRLVAIRLLCEGGRSQQDGTQCRKTSRFQCSHGASLSREYSGPVPA